MAVQGMLLPDLQEAAGHVHVSILRLEGPANLVLIKIAGEPENGVHIT